MLRFFATILLFAQLTLPIAAAEATPFEFIKTLPGVRQVSADAWSASYLVDASSDVLERIRQGLQERGWSARVLSNGHVLLALQKDSHISINLQQNAVNGANMRLRYGDDTGTTPAAAPAPVAYTSHPAEPSDFGHGIIKGDKGRHSYKLSGDLVIDGNDNTIFLSGNCGKLTINGDGNHIVGDCHYRHIVFNGHDNSLEWSTLSNHEPPDVFNNGPNNTTISQ
jgi:hypothetical protein